MINHKPSSISQRRTFDWTVIIGFLFVSIFVGLLAASQQALLLAIPTLVALALPFLYFSTRNFVDAGGQLLLFGWTIMLLSTAMHTLTEIPVGYVLEFVIFGLSLSIVGRLWRHMRYDKALQVLVGLWMSYLLISIVSSFAGRSHGFSAIWQLQYNLKWPLMFGLGCMVSWSASQDKKLRSITKLSWMLLCAAVLVEILAPNQHRLLFGDPTDLNINPLLGIGLRYRGPFNHPGYLALTAAMLAVVSFIYLKTTKIKSWAIPLCAYVALTVLSGQRQEAFGLVLTFLVLFCVVYWKYWYLLLIFGILISAAFVAGAGYLEQIPMRKVLEQWGVIDGSLPLSERATLTYKGLAIASDYFPFGSGLGTYGGVGAQKYDQSMYLDLGFGNYWWFRQGKFLVDTFWPSIVAESGFFGAALLLLTMVILWLTLAKCAVESRGSPRFTILLMGLGALTLLLSNTPTSLILTDPRGSILFWYLIGSAWISVSRPSKLTAVSARDTASTLDDIGTTRQSADATHRRLTIRSR